MPQRPIEQQQLMAAQMKRQELEALSTQGPGAGVRQFYTDTGAAAAAFGSVLSSQTPGGGQRGHAGGGGQLGFELNGASGAGPSKRLKTEPETAGPPALSGGGSMFVKSSETL
jgi:hypothetical protein